MRKRIMKYVSFALALIMTVGMMTVSAAAATTYEGKTVRLAGFTNDGLKLCYVDYGSQKYYGYQDDAGVLVIPPVYREIGQFVDGKTLVLNKTDEILVIDKTNKAVKTVTKLGTINYYNNEWWNGVRVFTHTVAAGIARPDDIYAYNMAGEEVFTYKAEAGQYIDALLYEENVSFYLVNTTSDYGTDFSKHLIKEVTLDEDGKELEVPTYSNNVYTICDSVAGGFNGLKHPLKEGLQAAYIKNNGSPLFGFVDKSGKVIVPFEYRHVGNFGFAGAIVVDRDGVYEIIDKKGNVITEFNSIASSGLDVKMALPEFTTDYFALPVLTGINEDKVNFRKMNFYDVAGKKVGTFTAEAGEYIQWKQAGYPVSGGLVELTLVNGTSADAKLVKTIKVDKYGSQGTTDSRATGTIVLPDYRQQEGITSAELVQASVDNAISNMLRQDKECFSYVPNVDALMRFAEQALSKGFAVIVKDDYVELNSKLLTAPTTKLNDFKQDIVDTLEEQAVLHRDMNSVLRVRLEGDTGTVDIKKELTKVALDRIIIEVSDVELIVDLKDIKKDVTLTVNKESSGEYSFNLGGLENVRVGLPALKNLDDAEQTIFNEKHENLGGVLNPNTSKLEIPLRANATLTVEKSVITFADAATFDKETKEALAYLKNKGRVAGYEDNTFLPGKKITRAEFFSMLLYAISKNDPDAGNGGFKDVKQTDWFRAVAGAAKANQFTAGYEDNTFQPNNTMVKREFVVIAGHVLNSSNRFRMTDAEATATMKATYSDFALIPTWVYPRGGLMTMNGLLPQFENGLFVSDMEMTRGEAAKIIYKLYQRIY